MRTQHHPKHNRRHRCSVHVGRPSEQSHHCLSHGASDPSIAKPAESAAKCPPEHGSSSRGCCGCRPLPFLRSLRTAVVLSWPGASQTRTLTPPFYRAGTPTESCYCRSHALVSLSSSEWGLLCIAFAVVRVRGGGGGILQKILRPVATMLPAVSSTTRVRLVRALWG